MEIILQAPTQIIIKHKEENQDRDLEADLSIERDYKQNGNLAEVDLDADIEVQPDKNLPSLQEEELTLSKKDLETNPLYHRSWDEIQSYIRSFTGQSLESLESYISTLAEIPDSNEAGKEQLANKKWAIFDLVKLGLNDNQIREAFLYLETLPNEVSKEDMIKGAIEKILETEQNAETSLKIESQESSHKSSSEKEHPVIIWRPAPPPPNFKLKKTKETQDSEHARKEHEVQNNEKTKLNSPAIKRVTCPICLDSVPEYLVESPLKCKHSFCRQCYKSYLQETIQNNQVLNVLCPSDGCQEIFEDKQITDLLEVDQALRYNRLKKVALLNQNPNLKWCVRPGCEKYVIGKKGMRKLECECGMKICFKCGNEYHPRKSCDSMVDIVYKKYANEKNVQNCPHCKSRTEKIDGCNHITCTICTNEWCWLCRRKYTPDHYSMNNQNGCPGLQNADNRPPLPSKWKTFPKKALAAIGYALIFPFLLILAIIYLPHWLYDKHMESKLGSEYNQNPNTDPILRFGLTVLGIVGFPILILGLVLYGCYRIFKPKNKVQRGGRQD